MNNIREYLSNTRNSVIRSLQRFPTAVFLAAVFALVNALLIHDVIDEEYPRAVLALTVGIELAVITVLSDEKGITRLGRIISSVISVAVSAVLYIVLGRLEITAHIALILCGIIIALGMAFAYLLYRNDEDKPVFGYMVQSAIYCSLAVLVANVGLVISILAFYSLIYEFRDMEKVIFDLTNIMFLVYFVMMCGYVPDRNTEIKLSRTYSTVFNRIGFTVYLSLIAILYIYIIKIILTWQLPVGRLNWFGSLALLFYVLFYLSMSSEEGKPQKLFIRYGGIMLLPILAIQLFAIYIRVSAYGLTELRYASLVMIVFAVLFIINSIIRKKVTWIFVAGAIISLLVTVTPLNIIDVPCRDQASRLMKVVNKYSLMVGGKYKYDDRVTAEDREILISCHDFLRYSEGKMSDEVKKIASLTMDELVGGNTGPDRTDEQWMSYSNIGGKEADISAYQTVSFFSSYDVTNVCGYDLTDIMMELFETSGGEIEYDSILLLEIDDNTAILVNQLSVQIWEGSYIGYFDIQGCLLRGGTQ